MYDDAVNPVHYNCFEHQHLDIVYERWGWPAVISQATKYLLRCGKKDPVLQEIKKARAVLDYLAQRLEREESDNREPVQGDAGGSGAE